MKKQEFKLFNDLQGTRWFLDKTESINGWREYAIEWAKADCLNEVVDVLERLDENDVMDFISDIWELEFKALT